MTVKEFKEILNNYPDDSQFIIENRLPTDFAVYMRKSSSECKIIIEEKTCINCKHLKRQGGYCFDCIGKNGWELRK
jgi:hypothetical protein